MAASDLGRVIKAKREIQGLSVAKAAGAARVSPAYLSKLENGGVTNPSPHFLHQLSPVLGIPYVELMRLAGYVVPKTSGRREPGIATALHSEHLSDHEAEHLLMYLKVMRQQKGRK